VANVKGCLILDLNLNNIMTVIQKIFLALFALFLAIIPVWLYLVVPELLKLPGDYERRLDLIGTEKPNYLVGEDSEESLIYTGNRKTSWTLSGDDKVSAELFFNAETISGDPLFEITKKYDIDVNTRKIISKDDNSRYLIPPMHLEKRGYTIIDPTNLIDVEFSFEKVENVNGLEVYHFKGNNLGKDSTDGYALLELVPEVYNSMDDVFNELWIEPTTGIIVNFKQTGESFYLDKLTNNRIHAFTKYTNKYNDDTVANQVRLAQNEKQKIQLYEIWIPILLVLISLAFLIALFASRRAALTPKR
jgi:hypothetical protein